MKTLKEVREFVRENINLLKTTISDKTVIKDDTMNEDYLKGALNAFMQVDEFMNQQTTEIVRAYTKWKAFTRKTIRILERHPNVIDAVTSYLAYRTFLDHDETLNVLQSDLLYPIREVGKSMSMTQPELHFRLHRIKYIHMDKDSITFKPRLPLQLDIQSDGFKVDKDLIGVKRLKVTIDGPLTLIGHVKVETDSGKIVEHPFTVEKYMLDELSDFVLQLNVAHQKLKIDANDSL